ncbi:hypothetical protein A2363_02720 [Candidatus Gottesmanbacteria bacterium RIFOXYB1_FULL_47_11]|uniref:Uncharacterized protein n=1 Tax=Candidatus Gottesmanbacteria bacterium RIFOXYB1_FULL_47_11 TaxID=1798401 RepID=A0A1F6BEW0_9BACT|nr:MAG: hypothetical protein A2363_02720 [Candidatus Gottesmanbacteria bacterium RIFOXYB1_FULL_47_11]
MLPTKEAPKLDPFVILIPERDGKPPYKRFDLDIDIQYLGLTPEDLNSISIETIRTLAEWKLDAEMRSVS